MKTAAKPAGRRAEKRAEKRAANSAGKLAAKTHSVAPVPMGLLAEAEVVGACLAAGQGAGLLAGQDAELLVPGEAFGPLASKLTSKSRAAVRSSPAQTAACNGPTLAVPHCPALELQPGAEVRLKGLVAAPELNGALGRLQEFHSDRGRWAVILPGTEPPKLVRPQNLEPVGGPRPAVADPGPALPLEDFNMSLRPMTPCGVEVLGFNTRIWPPQPALRELEKAMAKFGFALFRGQGTLTGVEQCILSEMFGTGQLHSTHGVHRRAPNQHILRLSNDPDEGFNEVGSEWHHDGASVQNVFGHVIYHIVRAPRCEGETLFSHTGDAYDALPAETQQELERLASVNSNGGIVHPLVFTHPRSGRRSVFLHLGMTGAMLRCDGRPGAKAWEGIDALDEAEINEVFEVHNRNLDAIAYKHRWREGDVIVIDNLAVAHKAAANAFKMQNGLRILHRTTIAGDWPLVPPPDLRIPPLLDTAGPSPFGSRKHVWASGYSGLRWGSWRERTVPH
mmetsp:Transcript_57766/g.162947  ORF Transcript_57766/g.162947 Transcript_57766/m.162947 type:complete len:506 (-) Transcript_57766:237-1754(-)